MTENIPQTSASDRIEQARKALAEYEHDNEGAPWLYNPEQDDSAALALALRALITPPHSHESLSDLALKIHTAAINAAEDAGITITTDLDSIMRNATNRAVYAGMQRAHEVWEPEVALRPSQEQMLRWLGIEHDVLSYGQIHISEQFIDREEI